MSQLQRCICTFHRSLSCDRFFCFSISQLFLLPSIECAVPFPNFESVGHVSSSVLLSSSVISISISLAHAIESYQTLGPHHSTSTYRNTADSHHRAITIPRRANPISRPHLATPSQRGGFKQTSPDPDIPALSRRLDSVEISFKDVFQDLLAAWAIARSRYFEDLIILTKLELFLKGGKSEMAGR